ncbi:uncharacterized protein METZ01_LOCUS242731, partial [marine metagenome]
LPIPAHGIRSAVGDEAETGRVALRPHRRFPGGPSCVSGRLPAAVQLSKPHPNPQPVEREGKETAGRFSQTQLSLGCRGGRLQNRRAGVERADPRGPQQPAEQGRREGKPARGPGELGGAGSLLFPNQLLHAATDDRDPAEDVPGGRLGLPDRHLLRGRVPGNRAGRPGQALRRRGVRPPRHPRRPRERLQVRRRQRRVRRGPHRASAAGDLGQILGRQHHRHSRSAPQGLRGGGDRPTTRNPAGTDHLRLVPPRYAGAGFERSLRRRGLSSGAGHSAGHVSPHPARGVRDRPAAQHQHV